jgi:hypothetical protein
MAARGAQIRTRLWDLLERHAYSDDHRPVWVAGSIAQALEHHQAIALLIDGQLTGSAFALVRPLVETVVRAHWINAVASDEQVKRARDDDKYAFPSMKNMSAEVGRAYDADELFQGMTAEWDAMCSYTHSGARQIAYRFTGTNVKPSYKEEAKVQVLNHTNMALLFLARMFFMSAGHQPESDEVRTMLLDHAKEFGERLQATSQPSLNKGQ